MPLRKAGGFTLIEMLVVIIIIGFLTLGIAQILKVSIGNFMANRELNTSFQDANHTLAMITRELRQGTNVSTATSQINFTDVNNAAIIYRLTSGKLFRSVNGANTLLVENVTGFTVDASQPRLIKITLTVRVNRSQIQLTDSIRPRNL